MDSSSPFLSSCSRRQWARRRGPRARNALLARLLPAVVAAALVLVWAGAFLAGRGGF